MERISPVRVTPRGGIAIGIVIVFTIGCSLAGAFLTTFEFVFEGLTGFLLQDAATVQYSFVTLGLAFPDATGYPTSFGTRWLQACYFIFGLAMPLLTLTACLCMWFVPLTIERQQFMQVCTEILNAWSALDVFGLAVIAGVLQLPLVRLCE